MTTPTELGQTEECSVCGMVCIAKMSNYKDYENKLQWQDPKTGKAHYKYDKATKKTSCNGPQGQQTITATAVMRTTLDDQIKDAEKVTKAFIDLCIEMDALSALANTASVFNTIMMRN